VSPLIIAVVNKLRLSFHWFYILNKGLFYLSCFLDHYVVWNEEDDNFYGNVEKKEMSLVGHLSKEAKG